MSTVTKLVNNRFGGIRRKDSSFSGDMITCSDCQNVELFFTKLNSGVGIRTASGNINITTYVEDEEVISIIPDDEEVIGLFETTQDGVSYMFAYTESDDDGTLYNIDVPNKTATVLKGSLTKTGKACGTDFTQGYLDMFIFSNGKEFVYVYSDTTTHTRLQIETAENLHLIDGEGRNVSGLGIVVFDSRLWVFNGKVLWHSEQAECRNFTPSGQDVVTDAGHIEFVKNITAIAPYLGSLAVFHSNSSCLVTIDSETVFAQGDESPGGCASYNALVFHGTDLYFYDDTKKGVFSFKQIVNGDKTLGDNIAVDLQDELSNIQNTNIDKIKALSVVTKDRNEVWFLVPISNEEDYSYILIYDYIRGEWIKRKCQHINTFAIINNSLYSAGKEIYEEYTGFTFDGEFIDSYYTCSIFNLGEDNTMKITKFPPRLTVDGNSICDFWVDYIKNYQALKKPKTKRIKSKQIPNVAKYNSGFKYNNGCIYRPNVLNAIVKIPSATFKALEIKFYTKTAENRFAIKTMEFSKLKVKQI